MSNYCNWHDVCLKKHIPVKYKVNTVVSGFTGYITRLLDCINGVNIINEQKE